MQFVRKRGRKKLMLYVDATNILGCTSMRPRSCVVRNAAIWNTGYTCSCIDQSVSLLAQATI